MNLGLALMVDISCLTVCLVASIYVTRFPPPPHLSRPVYFSILCSAFFAAGDFGSRLWAGHAWLADLWSSVLYIGLTGLVFNWWLLTLRIAWSKNPDASRGKTQAVVGIHQALWIAFICANPWHGLFMDLDPDRNIPHTLWFVYSVTQYLLMVATVCLAWRVVRQTRHTLDREQGQAILVGTSLPFLTNLIYISWPEPLPIDLTQLGVTACLTIYVGAICRHRLYANSTITLANALDWDMTPSVLVDTAGQILHINESGRTLLGPGVNSKDNLLAVLCGKLRHPHSAALVPPELSLEMFSELGTWREEKLIVDNGVDRARLWRLAVGPVGNQEVATGLLVRFYADAEGIAVAVTDAQQPVVVGGSPDRPSDLATAYDMKSELQVDARLLELPTRYRPIAQRGAEPVDGAVSERLHRLATGVVHGFNNILTAISGNAELAQLRLGDKHDEMAERLDRIVQGVARGTAVTRDLGAYTGYLPKALTETNLVKLCRRVVQRRSGKYRVEFSAQIDESSAHVLGEVDELERALGAIVDNAEESLMRLADGRAGSVTVEVGRVWLSADSLDKLRRGGELETGAYLYCRITDTGPGMDQYTLQRAFDPYYSTIFFGRGMGLAVVDGVIAAHGGTVSLTSEATLTTVTVYLPLGQTKPNDSM